MKNPRVKFTRGKDSDQIANCRVGWARCTGGCSDGEVRVCADITSSYYMFFRVPAAIRLQTRGLRISARVCIPNPFLYTSVSELEPAIQSKVLSARPPTTETVLNALGACRRLLVQIHDHDKFQRDVANTKVHKSMETLLCSEHVAFTPALLKSALLLHFPSSAAVRILRLFYQRNPHAAVDLGTALIPFRFSLYDGDTRAALQIADLTTGHPNYILAKHRVLRGGVLRFAATAIGVTLFSKLGVTQLVEWGVLQPAWTHLGSINAMVLTYLFNSSFFVTIVKFGRQLSAAGGDYLTWQKGTFYSHWYKHADEMAMCTRILETDVQMNGGVEPSEWLVQELCRTSDRDESGTLAAGVNRAGEKIRLLAPKDNLAELKLQAYWMSGGDGFEWVEPDQDPAEIMWRQHMQRLHRPALGEQSRTLKWADDLVDAGEKA